MKLTPSELISTFRKKISLQSFLFLLLITVILILVFLSRPHNPFFKGAESGGIGVLVAFGFLFFERRKNYLKMLDPDNPETSQNKFETALENDYQSFRRADMIRLTIGAILMLAMLILIFFYPQTQLAGVIASFWIGYVLISMLKSWWLMKDGMMLQDLKHALNDQTSEPS